MIEETPTGGEDLSILSPEALQRTILEEAEIVLKKNVLPGQESEAASKALEKAAELVSVEVNKHRQYVTELMAEVQGKVAVDLEKAMRNASISALNAFPAPAAEQERLAELLEEHIKRMFGEK